MRRRSVLVSFAATVAPGCVGNFGQESKDSSSTPSTASSTTPTPPTPRSATSSTTLSATPTLDDLPCPPERVAPDAAVCSHEVNDAPVVVRATERVIPADDPGTAFVLTNGTGERLRFNPHNPDVYRYTGDGYAVVERRSSGTGVVTVPPEGTHRWRLPDLAVVDRLSPGTFLFAVSVPTAGTMDVDRVTCLTPFRLTAGRA